MTFGVLLRNLRYKSGIGIKKLAPELGVTYGYLSKLENADATPSEEFVYKVAAYFQQDVGELLLSAGKVPPDVLKILRENPQEAVEFLRARFGRSSEAADHD